MAPAPSIDLDVIIESLAAAEIARNFALASFTLNLWDIIICLDKEIQYFWTGAWTVSRVLYLWNRYVSPFLQILVLICFFHPSLSDKSCENGIKACFAINVIALATIQLVLVLRIWYLFPRSRTIRAMCIFSFVTCTILSAIFVGESFPFFRSIQIDIPGVRKMGCAIPAPVNLWRLFIPPLVLHTVLFVFTTVRALRTPNLFQEAPLMRRILRDGGIFYFVVIVVVGLTAVFSFFTNKPKINIPAIYSGTLLCLCSIAISRLMLSIQSVADRLGFNESWILNNVELSRVVWRKGSHDGEIIVEVDPGDPIELTNVHENRICDSPTDTTDHGHGGHRVASPYETENDVESGEGQKGNSKSGGLAVRVTRLGYLDDPHSGPRSPLPDW
ncbi:hypothetical protein K435DRAFT_754063 [Dendrothele bispora CBS 962.96]|uniref:DUF6533 domain-containing protein n=1 Tax=Dendrothele bispora (strain CBS 962.96) TaxID=1314807 RepID=A0A4S8M5R5_DENBC|nr:hypothetical protein K435DRAFT_754063 [Dendrothele bispora CBS 962.96]